MAKLLKVYIDIGHGGSDPGAVKYIVERDANLVTGLALKAYLEAHGVIVKLSRTNNNMTKSINARAAEANAWGADYVISVHNNAGGGDGFEVLCSVFGGKGKTLAENIEAEVKKLGQNSRGIKQRKNASGGNYYGMIRLTDAPCVICEGVFVDNATDVTIADTEAEQKEFGYAYARGFLKTVGIEDNGIDGKVEPPAKPVTENKVEKLVLDKSWGKDTTRKSQRILGTYEDGTVSNQPASNKKYLPNCHTSSWQFKAAGYRGGSAMVTALQELVGAIADGYFGKQTVIALQKFLKAKGFYTGEVDGYMGPLTVLAWQKYVNSKL